MQHRNKIIFILLGYSMTMVNNCHKSLGSSVASYHAGAKNRKTSIVIDFLQVDNLVKFNG